MKYSTRKKLFGFCLVLPWIIGFVVFLLYPLSQTILYSFSNVTITPQGTETAPVGFKNYTDVLFTDPDFTLGIPTFLRQMVFMVPMIVVFSLLFALLLNSHIRGQRIYRAIFFLPVILISGPVLERIRQVGATICRASIPSSSSNLFTTRSRPSSPPRSSISSPTSC